jgi:hypothetical protein
MVNMITFICENHGKKHGRGFAAEKLTHREGQKWRIFLVDWEGTFSSFWCCSICRIGTGQRWQQMPR